MLILDRTPRVLRKIINKTSFWRDNWIILRELKYFPTIAITALVGTLLAAIFEGATVGLIASFLQVLTTPEKPPIETGIEWLDVSLLATKASSTARIYRLSALILFAIWLRSGLNYLGQYYSRLAQSNLCDRLRKRLFEQLQSLSLSYYTTLKKIELPP
jgi:subfamily B ATP-binding cassette protein MsbA